MTVTVTCYQNEPRDVYGIYQTGTKYYNNEVSWNRTITSQLMTVTVTCYQNEPRDVYGIYQTGTKYYNNEVFVELKLFYSHEFSHI